MKTKTKYGIHIEGNLYDAQKSYIGEIWKRSGIHFAPSHFMSYDDARKMAALLTKTTGVKFKVHQLLKQNEIRKDTLQNV